MLIDARRAMTIALCTVAMSACAPDYVESPPSGYVGSIDLDGRDFGRNHYGDSTERAECGVEPDGATRLSFVVESRRVHVGRAMATQVEKGSVLMSAPGQEPHYEVDLPWSHVKFDASACKKTENRFDTGREKFTVGAAQIECTDAERGDSLKVAVQYQGC